MTLAIVPPLMGIVLAPIERRRMNRAVADNDDDPASDVRVAAE